MRNCDETRQWLDAYLDNELDPVNTLEIEQHLQTCPACSQAYEELRALGAALSTVPRYPTPAALRERIHSALLGEASAEAQTIPFAPAARPSWRWVTALAARRIRFLLGFFIFIFRILGWEFGRSAIGISTLLFYRQL